MTAGPAAAALAALRTDALGYVLALGVILTAAAAAAVSADRLGWTQATAAVAAYGVAGALIWRGLGAHLPHIRFGAANAVTLARCAVAALLAGLLVAPTADDLLWSAAGLGLAAVMLDGVDGPIARRRALTSRFGSRFDMETDAALMLVLSLLLTATGKTGAWILAAGLARYVFVAAGWLAPALRAPLPHSERRRVVCAVQSLALVVAVAPAVPSPWAAAIAASGLCATLASFAIDVLWLLRARPAERA